ncbi:MAG: Hsp20/alpha crystallin family protein [Candidatus Omnitrophica bacterium]|nr:Hsp20/alpha crystallin family protein [Candidatus Omnitrophota bacterium]
MAIGIPPRTMRDVWRQRGGSGIKLPPVQLGLGKINTAGPPPAADTDFRPAVFKKPREWRYETKPIFKKLTDPLVDVFKEAKEVQIIIDMGGFSEGDINLSVQPDKYIINAKYKGQEFNEEIELPPDVDISKTEEIFRNGILQIKLPRKKKVKKNG